MEKPKKGELSIRRSKGDGMEVMPERHFKASGRWSGDDVKSIVAKAKLPGVHGCIANLVAGYRSNSIKKDSSIISDYSQQHTRIMIDNDEFNFDPHGDQHGMLIPVHKMKLNLDKSSQAYFHTNEFVTLLSTCDSRHIWTDVSKSSTIAMRGCTTVHMEQTVAMGMQIDGDCKRRVVKHTMETVGMPEYFDQETFQDSDFLFFVSLLPLLFLCWFFLLTSGISSMNFSRFAIILIVLFLFSVRSSIYALIGKVTSAMDGFVQPEPPTEISCS